MEVATGVSAQSLDIDDRLALVEEIWGSICADTKTFPLNDAQRAELDRRVADDDAFRADLILWDEVKATIRTRHGSPTVGGRAGGWAAHLYP